MSLWVLLVVGFGAYVIGRFLFGGRTVKVQSERHDVLRLPDGGMVHDQNCRNHGCRNHVRGDDA